MSFIDITFFCLIFFLTWLDQVFFTKWCYSPDVIFFRFGFALNPDSSICMNCRYSPWLFFPYGLCFVEDTVDPLIPGYGQTFTEPVHPFPDQPHIHANTIRSSREQHRCSHNL